MALPYVKKRIKQNLKVSKSQNMMRKKNLFSAFSSDVRVCAFINHLYRESALTTTPTRTPTGRSRVWTKQK